MSCASARAGPPGLPSTRDPSTATWSAPITTAPARSRPIASAFSRASRRASAGGSSPACGASSTAGTRTSNPSPKSRASRARRAGEEEASTSGGRGGFGMARDVNSGTKTESNPTPANAGARLNPGTSALLTPARRVLIMRAAMVNPLLERAPPKVFAERGQVIEKNEELALFPRLSGAVEADLVRIAAAGEAGAWGQRPVAFRLTFGWADTEHALPALEGHATVDVPAVCQRCLERFELALGTDFRLLFSGPGGPADESL